MKKRRGKGRRGDSASKKQKPSSEITADLFIEKAVLDGKIRPWQRKEIAVFFKDMKLKEKEDSEIFEETLKKY